MYLVEQIHHQEPDAKEKAYLIKKRWADNLLKKSSLSQRGFLPYKQKPNLYIKEINSL